MPVEPMTSLVCKVHSQRVSGAKIEHVCFGGARDGAGRAFAGKGSSTREGRKFSFFTTRHFE